MPNGRNKKVGNMAKKMELGRHKMPSGKMMSNKEMKKMMGKKKMSYWTWRINRSHNRKLKNENNNSLDIRLITLLMLFHGCVRGS